MMDNNEVELLELIAELGMSSDRSRQAIGAEVKRLTTALRADLAALRARLAELVCPECDSRVMDNGYCMMGHWCGKPLK
jgi:hypothetical protein